MEDQSDEQRQQQEDCPAQDWSEIPRLSILGCFLTIRLDRASGNFFLFQQGNSPIRLYRLGLDSLQNLTLSRQITLQFAFHRVHAPKNEIELAGGLLCFSH